MRHARPGMLRFVASQSPEGMALLEPRGLVPLANETMIAVVGNRSFVRSAAVVQVAARLRWPYRIQAALWAVPKPIRDAGYRFVSRRRARLR